jgi:hypothetical protein
MHSRSYLDKRDFQFVRGTKRRGLSDIFSEWTPAERVVFVAPDPIEDMALLAGFVLARTALFYGREETRSPAFFNYPNHYVVGGEQGAETRLLGPTLSAEWTPAWCNLDVWPSTHHAVAEPVSSKLLAAAFMLEPTVLVWPAWLSTPELIDLPAGPTDDISRSLLKRHVHEVWFYDNDSSVAQSGWQLTCSGGARQLRGEAIDLLPRVPDTASDPAFFRCADPREILDRR